MNILHELGFSPNEAKIYETLLDLKEAGPGKISSQAKVHRRNVYDALNRLIDKGLVFSVIDKGESVYSAVDPDKLLELVKEKEAGLNALLPELKKRYENKKPLQEAYIYRGIEGFKNYMRDVLRVGQDVYVIGAKLSWLDPRIINYTEKVVKEMARKKINFHILYDALAKDDGQDYSLFGKDCRFLPKEYQTNSTINIFGDYVINYTGLAFKKIDDAGTLFIIRDENLADSYRKWFKFMWNNCK